MGTGYCHWMCVRAEASRTDAIVSTVCGLPRRRGWHPSRCFECGARLRSNCWQCNQHAPRCPQSCIHRVNRGGSHHRQGCSRLKLEKSLIGIGRWVRRANIHNFIEFFIFTHDYWLQAKVPWLLWMTWIRPRQPKSHTMLASKITDNAVGRWTMFYACALLSLVRNRFQEATFLFDWFAITSSILFNLRQIRCNHLSPSEVLSAKKRLRKHDPERFEMGSIHN